MFSHLLKSGCRAVHNSDVFEVVAEVGFMHFICVILCNLVVSEEFIMYQIHRKYKLLNYMNYSSDLLWFQMGLCVVVCFDRIHCYHTFFVVVLGICRCIVIFCKEESYKLFAVFICVCKLVINEYCICIGSYFDVCNVNFNLCACFCENKRSSDVVAVVNTIVQVGHQIHIYTRGYMTCSLIGVRI
jgi:hypothetical protein